MPIDENAIESLSSSAEISLGKAIALFVIFFDLCKSTNFKSYCMKSKVPDGFWIERQLIYLHRIIGLVDRYGGKSVKTIGDEVMAYFPNQTPAETVIKCATDSHSLFRSIDRYDNDRWRIVSKVSIDYGAVFDSNFGLVDSKKIDPVGLIVDRCARLNRVANENEVVFSSSVFSLLSAAAQMSFSLKKEECELAGIGPSELYRIAVG